MEERKRNPKGFPEYIRNISCLFVVVAGVILEVEDGYSRLLNLQWLVLVFCFCFVCFTL